MRYRPVIWACRHPRLASRDLVADRTAGYSRLRDVLVDRASSRWECGEAGVGAGCSRHDSRFERKECFRPSTKHD